LPFLGTHFAVGLEQQRDDIQGSFFNYIQANNLTLAGDGYFQGVMHKQMRCTRAICHIHSLVYCGTVIIQADEVHGVSRIERGG
jgi:hypothetical protein